MIDFLFFIVLIIVFTYVIFAGIAIFGYLKEDSAHPANSAETNPSGISIIIPCRNEEKNIKNLLADLKRILSENSIHEVFVIDDHSSDETYTIASQEMFCNVVRLTNEKAGKKQALTTGVKLAANEIILCLDADVRISETFSLENITSFFRLNKECNYLIFPIKIVSINNFFGLFHLFEHFALTTFMVGFAKFNSAFLSHGACMAFRKHAFDEVNGFEGNLHLTSGDDVFLLEKIKAYSPKSICIIPALQEPARVEPVYSLDQLFSQRIRWASKFNNNKFSLNYFVAISVGLMNLFLVISPFLIFINQMQLTTYFIVAGIKFLIDFLLLFLSSKFFKQTKYLWFYPVFFWIYPLFAFSLVIAVFFRKVKWKGRQVN